MELRKFIAPEFIFGENAISLAGQYSVNFGGRKALIVTDSGVQKAGWTQEVTESLEAKNIEYYTFSSVTQNPREEEVMRGAELYKENQCNFIIAVGGGSPMDCAKGIGIVVSNNKHILNYEGVDNVEKPIPPLICVPTTGGTAADVSQFSIITNQEDKVKIAIISKTIIPDISLIDPRTLLTMDPYLTACTGLDALVHAFEAYVSNASSEMTDMHAIKAVELISQYLLPSINEPENLFYKSQMMFASLQAGLAFSNASLGIVHSMAHSLGGLLDLPHGECNALLLNHVVNYNFESAAEKYQILANFFGKNIEDKSLDYNKKQLFSLLQNFRENAGVKSSLKSRGVKLDDLSMLAKKAFNDACSLTNPRKPSAEDIEVIYEEAL